MEIKHVVKSSLAVLGALSMLVLAGCGGSSGGGTVKKAEKAPIEKLVEEKGKEVTVNTVKLKFVTLASEVKKLKSPTYMPNLVYQKGAFYGIDEKTKSMVKLVIKDGTFAIENSNVIPNVKYIYGTDGENMYYRPEGKMPQPRVLTKDGKDMGPLLKGLGYLTPAPDGKTVFSWSNSGAILKLARNADGTVEEAKRPYQYLPKDDRYITAGWFAVGPDSYFVRGRQMSTSKKDQPLREHRFDGTLKATYGQKDQGQQGTYAILKNYVVHARHNSQGYDIYSRSDGKIKANIPYRTFGTNMTLMASTVNNTFVICDSFSKVPKLIVVTIQ